MHMKNSEANNCGLKALFVTLDDMNVVTLTRELNEKLFKFNMDKLHSINDS